MPFYKLELPILQTEHRKKVLFKIAYFHSGFEIYKGIHEFYKSSKLPRAKWKCKLHGNFLICVLKKITPLTFLAFFGTLSIVRGFLRVWILFSSVIISNKGQSRILFAQNNSGHVRHVRIWVSHCINYKSTTQYNSTKFNAYLGKVKQQ